jgi:hypothetical protein
VDDGVLVGAGESLGDRGGDLDGSSPGEPLAGDPLAQGLALEQLGDGVGDIALAADVVNGEEIRVGEGGEGSRSKRLMRSGSRATASGRTLRATSRPRRESRAR